MNNLDRAYKIALDNLRSRYAENGIHAGASHFDDLWTRDAMYACLGALSVQDTPIVQTTLATLLQNTACTVAADAPVRVGAYHMLLKFLGIPQSTKARYVEDKVNNHVADSNPLIVLLFCKLIEELEKTMPLKASVSVRKHITTIDSLLYMYYWTKSFDTTLFPEKAYGNWADSLKKEGAVLYSNVLWYAAFKKYAEVITEYPGAYVTVRGAKVAANALKQEINKQLWNGKYFSDFIDNKGVRHDNFSTDGNMLAIIFGLATKKQTKSILAHAAKMQTSFVIPTRDVAYSKSLEYPVFRAIGMGDYHNGVLWTWLGAIHAVAANDVTILEKLADKIVEDGAVYEVYDPKTNKPLKRLLYKSEKNFAWSSGLFVWAYNQLTGGNRT